MHLFSVLAFVLAFLGLVDAAPKFTPSKKVNYGANRKSTAHYSGHNDRWKPPSGWYGGRPASGSCNYGNSYNHRNCPSGRTPSCNSANNRACWTSGYGGYSINTDYEAQTPTTGVTRQYTLLVTEEHNWTGPDGVVKELVMLINGSLPGPNLVADWGDQLEITVINGLEINGTSMHWHGIRQLNTNLQDGVNGVTECPIPPGSSRVYKFLAQQYGTSWYHSHFSAQYGNGVVGTIQINGPASLNYDIDLGAFPVTDYYYDTSDNLVEYTENNGPPPSDNVLFNGTNVHPTSGAGKYASVTLTPGKRHRLRIINTSVENHFVFSLVGHSMTIIAADFVPVQPQTVDQLFVGVGQRYDVTIDASMAVGNYWFNATFVTGAQCGESYNPYPAAIFRYKGASTTALPTTPGTTAAMDTCTDLSNLQPVLQRHISTKSFQSSKDNTLPVTLDLTQTGQLFSWRVNGTKVAINWEKPVDQYVMQGSTAYPPDDNVVTVTKKDQWIFWVIENDPTIGIAHPIHLHGHDFLLLGRSDPNNPTAFTSADMAKLSGNNPVRRDVVMLPSLGWIVIGYKTDNPGTWLMHCHIAWHVSGGLAVNFLERPADLKARISAADKTAFDNQCAAWNEYYPSKDPYRQSDSGLRRREPLESGDHSVSARTIKISDYF
ncbi:laccase [Ophiostoma piceae UAMH 11346]|uniref:laccase n=1 Tax=Ophiostoma piceae (strain UAMH 11346) TaxID=1262450 RepID=S3D280_OPHP1|nr:laccase [Ophiostoma piceae UAMH 11346]